MIYDSTSEKLRENTAAFTGKQAAEIMKQPRQQITVSK